MAVKVSLSDVKKAYRYYQKNGFLPALFAAVERIQYNNIRYEKRVLTKRELEEEKRAVWTREERFSILVPAYETDERHFREMIDSVLCQTYPHFELIVADASASDKLAKVMKYYSDGRIRYIRLPGNRGISENTNEALKLASGSYIGLLDHDDRLEPDALYRMMKAIEAGRERSCGPPWLLYSDEDKGNGDMSRFYEPHRKGKFNLDLLLSNHYMCHFLVMKAELMKELGFRREYDGAQDHDLVLRAAERLLPDAGKIVHVPYVLYHWRCHAGSTADNPDSKRYAYEAGRRAVEDFCRRQGWKARVVHTRHLGFFRVVYEGNILEERPDVAAVGGRIVSRGKIAGGAYRADGTVLYKGLPVPFSGYMHRAVLQQDVAAVDVRKMTVRAELRPVFDAIRREEKDPAAAGLCFGREAARRGYRILWDPFYGEGGRT